ncbi:hypothetical protein PVT67_14490 [Gallaecimonas kandeliae]|uniref:hypothetical protein n=1 Tax=Gallaecimonas kandeliae TaxID=3029055 RepID=UPI002648FD0D|nr:hypothetical protein [Gallaecimonas kandeliae]WKE64862.1 hypothetical protein PVT67_14490 [Gallaecimonas kandeliae]
MNNRYFSAVFLGGLVAGALDITFAISFAAYNGHPPVRLLQIVASGLFGNAALTGGLGMAAWGLALHFFMSLLWAGIFLALALRLPALVRSPLASGIAFGAIVFLAMRLIVLPLSAFPFPVAFKLVATILDLLSHTLLFGIPIAFASRWALAPAPQPA